MKIIFDETQTINYIKIISYSLTSLKNKNKQEYKKLPFYNHRIPDITIEKYYRRLYKYMNKNPYIFILSLSYINRYINNNPLISINIYTIHSLILTSLILSLKYLEDNIYDNKYYSYIGGFELNEINELEIEMLKYLDYDLRLIY